MGCSDSRIGGPSPPYMDPLPAHAEVGSGAKDPMGMSVSVVRGTLKTQGHLSASSQGYVA